MGADTDARHFGGTGVGTDPQKPGQLRYRADIDGLRAVAVLPVVFYHAGVRGFSGGFVGVDIFFVISGYLITAILLRERGRGLAALAIFYRRRILRIFPALVVMLLATTAAAAFVLLPLELDGYAGSLATTALFASNLLFYAHTDYFNPAGVSQPLLHCWSLAVEEQFYLLWPLLLAALVALPRGARNTVVVLGCAVSLLLAAKLLTVDPAASFYLFPPRAWELGTGALLAIAPVTVQAGWRAEAVGALGLAAILGSIKLYTHETAFPGLAAVPPCAGAVLLIATGEARTLVARLLSIRPAAFVGAISYSLYLWHWPVIVFAEIGLFLPHRVLTTVGVIAVSLLLATASWAVVERPFRARRSWSTRRVLMAGAGAVAGLLVVSAAFPPVARALARFTPGEARMAAYIATDGDSAYRRGECFMAGPRSHYDAARCLAISGRRPAVLVVGDSHAAQLWPGLSRDRRAIDVLQATATGCVARRFPPPWHGYCEAVIDGALHGWLATHRPAALVLASRWRGVDLPGLAATLRDPLVRRSNPVVVGPIPQYTAALPRLLAFADRRRDPGLPARSLDTDVFATDAAMSELTRRTGVRYVSLVALMCRDRVCRTLAAPGVPMQFDYGHLTPQGSAVVVDAILPALLPTVFARGPVQGR